MQDGVRTCDQYDSILADHPGEMTWPGGICCVHSSAFLKGKWDSDFHCTQLPFVSQSHQPRAALGLLLSLGSSLGFSQTCSGIIRQARGCEAVPPHNKHVLAC